MSMVKKVFYLGLLVFFAQVSYAHQTEIGAKVVRVKPLSVTAEPAGKHVIKIYLTLQNQGITPHALDAVYSRFAKQAQLQKVVRRRGRSINQRISSIIVTSKRTLRIRPGSYQIMLLGVTKSFTKADKIPLILIFRDGSWHKVIARME